MFLRVSSWLLRNELVQASVSVNTGAVLSSYEREREREHPDETRCLLVAVQANLKPRRGLENRP